MKFKREKQGFTLLEMLIVVAIIAILVAIAIPSFSKTLDKARKASDAANARALLSVLASLVADGEVTIPEKNNDASAQGIGMWVLVMRDNDSWPQAYGKKSGYTMYCSTDQGVTVGTETTSSWSAGNATLQRIVEQSMGGQIRSQSRDKNKDTGWDWYLVEYAYVPKQDKYVTFIYSGFKDKPSGLEAGTLNRTGIEKFMNRRNTLTGK